MKIRWVSWNPKHWQFGSVFRFNGGGYMYGSSGPYIEYNFGPIEIRKPLKKKIDGK
jgi:hypothetical protein